MEKKTTERKPFNFGESPLVKATEQTVVEGYQAIERKEQGGGEPPVQIPSANSEENNAVRRFHKEPTRDILVHCPASLHTRLTNYKMKLWDDLGERKTINNMVVEAIADWLDKIGA